MTIVKVAIEDNPYDIHVKAGLLDELPVMLMPFARGKRLLFVMDSNVEKHVWPNIGPRFAANGVETEKYILPAGEGAKSWNQLESLTDWLLSNQVERSDHIVALGGGVVGDITGFAAQILKRGCNFIQIPTSLLAQVDSSVGGKTAINASSGKNLIGAFHQPAMVLIDPEVLGSLPPRELSAGFAEVVKYGLIDDAEFFEWCAAHAEKFMAGDLATRSEAIIRSVSAKARIVAEDEKEISGKRALLNLGHTFGHALEAETGFSDRLLHGEAVACGIILAFRYSARLGLCSSDDAERIATLFALAQLPTTLREANVDSDGNQLAKHMLHDKKMSGGTLPFLLAKGIGQAFLSHDVELDDVAKFLDEERLQ